VVDVGVLITMLGEKFSGIWQVSLGEPGGVSVAGNDDGGRRFSGGGESGGERSGGTRLLLFPTDISLRDNCFFLFKAFAEEKGGSLAAVSLTISFVTHPLAICVPEA